MTKTYAGIGSRHTPVHERGYMATAAKVLGQNGFTLRSGGSWGADSAFEAGAKGSSIELFLPWQGFNDKDSPWHEPSEGALAIAAENHPKWDDLNDAAKLLLGRNVHILFGPDLNDPVQFVLCWTYAGYARGGTGHSIRIAIKYQLPIFNLGSMTLDEIQKGIEPFLTED